MEFITTKEASNKWGISPTRITILANEGRIPGAQLIGRRWLIPANSDKPPKRKAYNSNSSENENDIFLFPLFHCRPDFSSAIEAGLSNTQKKLLQAETAVMECRFTVAYPILKDILRNPCDIATEIGALGIAGLCCIALNYSKEFSGIFLRLQMLLSNDFPHRDDLIIILDILKTYLDTIDYTAHNYIYNPDIHEQALPLSCMMIGYCEFVKEIVKHESGNIAFMELNLRFLKNTGAVFVTSFLHCYLCGIYILHENIETAKKHASAMLQIAFENKLYFPLVTYYHYISQIFDSLFEQYPKEFKEQCQELSLQFQKNYSAFLLSINEDSTLAKLTADDYPYTQAVWMGLTNAEIAKKLGVSIQTVKRRLAVICEELGVNTKKEIIECLRNHT